MKKSGNALFLSAKNCLQGMRKFAVKIAYSAK